MELVEKCSLPPADEDPSDRVRLDILSIMDSFEQIFVAFLNQNYRSFTESECRKIIHDNLKQLIMRKVNEM
jgi:hypothetical protein